MSGNLQQILGQSFVPSDVPVSEYQLVTPSDYTVMIAGTEMKPTSTGGIQLVVDFQILGSQFDGCILKERLNIQNNNAKAVEISFQTLANIVTACGLGKINDSSELHGKKIMVTVDIKKGTGTYIASDGTEKPSSDQNVIKKFYPLNGATNTAATPSPAASSEPAKKLPWAK